MYFLLFVGVLSLYLCCYALLCVHSSFASILKWKRKLVYCYYKLFLMVSWVGLQCLVVVFPEYTHLLFDRKLTQVSGKCGKFLSTMTLASGNMENST